ncbi:MAG TPA: type II toxin-antitoxin system VapC family toxin [Solirubrobacterales bacterium]|jgi:predicted nucleic acid-binding protein|nr:type II toxin-antitoxin system VapC family toxin [Solirubrobacterales bacterium]
MPVIDVVSDANVALKWFHAEGEEEVEAARDLLGAHRDRRLTLSVLDLTSYEIGNALMRGRAEARADQTATVLEALAAICPALQPSPHELRRAAELAERRDLTLYGATYAAVAETREAALATLDGALLAAGLGARPAELLAAFS